MPVPSGAVAQCGRESQQPLNYALERNSCGLIYAAAVFHVHVLFGDCHPSEHVGLFFFMEPLVCPYAVMSLVSVQVSASMTPVVSLSFNHMRCTMKFFWAGILRCVTCSADWRFFASVTTDISKQNPASCVSLTASVSDRGPLAISCKVVASTIAASVVVMTPCVSAVNVDRTATLVIPTETSMKCQSPLVFSKPSRKKLAPLADRPSTSPSLSSSQRKPESE